MKINLGGLPQTEQCVSTINGLWRDKAIRGYYRSLYGHEHIVFPYWRSR